MVCTGFHEDCGFHQIRSQNASWCVNDSNKSILVCALASFSNEESKGWPHALLCYKKTKYMTMHIDGYGGNSFYP